MNYWFGILLCAAAGGIAAHFGGFPGLGAVVLAQIGMAFTLKS